MSSPSQAPRRYDSAGRRAQAQATRERIVLAARELFLAQGYAGTSIAQIAAAAGVSGPTVFAGFRSKVNLLKVATETALVGDTEPVPLAERPHMRQVHEAGTAQELLTRLAALIADLAPRACPIYLVVHAAAGTDPEIAELLRTLDEHRLTGAARLAEAVLERLGQDGDARLAEVRDTIWTLNSPLLYRLLVLERGWTPERYGAWIERSLIAHIL